MLPHPLGSPVSLLRAASRLDVWLRENVGDNSDWPVRLQCSGVATADALACLLSGLGAEVRAALERGVTAVNAVADAKRQTVLELVRDRGCKPCGTYECQVPMPLRGRRQEIDICIADLVSALNAANIQTVASCCGHGEQDGSVVLEDGRELVVRWPLTNPTDSKILDALKKLVYAEDRFIEQSGCKMDDEVADAVAYAKTVIAQQRDMRLGGQT
jgi:hypothetical protein